MRQQEALLRVTNNVATGGDRTESGGKRMLGQLLGEVRGRVTSLRALSSEGLESEVEISIAGEGTLLGKPVSDIGTYTQRLRPNGTAYADGHVILRSADGEMAPWKGFGISHFVGEGLAINVAAVGAFHGATPGFERLNEVAAVTEYQVDPEGNYHYQLWEWLGPNQTE